MFHNGSALLLINQAFSKRNICCVCCKKRVEWSELVGQRFCNWYSGNIPVLSWFTNTQSSFISTQCIVPVPHPQVKRWPSIQRLKRPPSSVAMRKPANKKSSRGRPPCFSKENKMSLKSPIHSHSNRDLPVSAPSQAHDLCHLLWLGLL